MKYQIHELKEKELANNIKPNVIHNRFDLFENADYKLYQYADSDVSFYFEALFSGKSAKLGIWLMKVDAIRIKRISKFLFRNNRQISYLFCENAYSSFGSYEKLNHFRIELPASIAELESRVSQKGRYNIKRNKRLLTELSGKISIIRCEPLSVNAQPLWEKYFEFKEDTFNHCYNMTPVEYCKTFHVTMVYALTIGEENRVIAVVLSCEQCPIVYLENLSYDKDYAKYSPGQILYDEYLKILIDSGRKEVHLLGGNYEYKKRYGSIEEIVFNCSLHRYEVIRRIKNRILNTV